jgi:hypothetical protein
VEVTVVATVEVRLVGSDLGTVMGEMRTWLDCHKIALHAFRESTCPGGLALHVEFDQPGHADEFAAQFSGRVLGTRPRQPGEPLAVSGSR